MLRSLPVLAFYEVRLPINDLSQMTGIPYEELLEFFYFAPIVLDFRELGGKAAEYVGIYTPDYHTLGIYILQWLLGINGV